MIGAVLDDMAAATGLDGPPAQDLADAETYCESIDGHEVDFGWTSGKQVYKLSPVPSVRNMQIKAMAWAFLVSRRKAETPEVTRETERLRLIAACEALEAGAEFAGAWFDNPNTRRTDVMDRLRFAPSDAHVVLMGNPGTGKTHAALVHCGRYMAFRANHSGGNWDGMFITGRDLASAMGADGNQSLKRRLFSVRRLIVDDLKVRPEGSVTPAYISFFEDLFIKRHANKRPTYITTNATKAQFSETYGPRITSRLNGPDVVVYSTNGPDLRPIIRNEMQQEETPNAT